MQEAEELKQQVAEMRKKLDAARSKATGLIILILFFGYLGGAWYSGQHARESFDRGFEAGFLSTQEGRDAQHAKFLEGLQHLACDPNGNRCVNK